MRQSEANSQHILPAQNLEKHSRGNHIRSCLNCLPSSGFGSYDLPVHAGFDHAYDGHIAPKRFRHVGKRSQEWYEILWIGGSKPTICTWSQLTYANLCLIIVLGQAESPNGSSCDNFQGATNLRNIHHAREGRVVQNCA